MAVVLLKLRGSKLRAGELFDVAPASVDAYDASSRLVAVAKQVNEVADL